jgi:uncharacterized protein YciI
MARAHPEITEARRTGTSIEPHHLGGIVHYLLFYDVVDDYITRRGPLRPAHLDYARPFVERGELILGGALADPPDAAILLFDAPSSALAEAFAQADPYVTNGLVRRWWVREWTTVVGRLAAAPIQSGTR